MVAGPTGYFEEKYKRTSVITESQLARYAFRHIQLQILRAIGSGPRRPATTKSLENVGPQLPPPALIESLIGVTWVVKGRRSMPDYCQMTINDWLGCEPGKTVKLAPGGYHVMLMDLTSPLKQGEKLPITLEFEKAGKVTVSFDVEGVAAQGPVGASGGTKDMKKMSSHSA
jgi:hypothetical protein